VLIYDTDLIVPLSRLHRRTAQPHHHVRLGLHSFLHIPLLALLSGRWVAVSPTPYLILKASVRPEAAGLLTGVEYSKVGSTAWVRPASTVTTRIKVGLVGSEETTRPTRSRTLNVLG